jgi:hypothetical protein
VNLLYSIVLWKSISEFMPLQTFTGIFLWVRYTIFNDLYKLLLLSCQNRVGAEICKGVDKQAYGRRANQQINQAFR